MVENDLNWGLREARQNLKNGKVREALARLFHLTEKYPEDREVKGEIAGALLVQGRHHAERGRIDQAREDFERSIRYSETPEGHIFLGRIHQIQGEYEDAFAEYTRALDLNENLPAIHENLGYYFIDIQDYEQAARAFGNALAIGATNRDVYLGLWRAYVSLERLDKAHEVIQDAIEKMPEDDVILTTAGVTSSMRHDLEEAEDHWLKALRANPKNVEATFHLAGLAASQGRRTESLSLMRKCAQLNVDRTRVLWKQDVESPHPCFTAYRGDEDFLDLFE
ncbi:MAG: tetratricopeptide repeat protein [Planctomycetes bacterium]|nr:tetratricopeptide repeat protein [Planctomycetota bacterium]